MWGCDPHAPVEAAWYFREALVPVGGNHSPTMMSHLKPHWWVRCAVRSLPLQFGGRVLSGRWGWQGHPGMWAQQPDTLHSFITNSRGGSTSPASSSFSFLLSPSLLLFLCFILLLIAEQFRASTHLRTKSYTSYLRQKDVSQVGGKEEDIPLSQQCRDAGGEQWAHPSLPLFLTQCCSTPLCGLCLQVGAAASGGEISCVIQTLSVKCKLLKAHRSCTGWDAAVFSLAQHYPSARTDTSSVWLLQIMETRNTPSSWNEPHQTSSPQAALVVPSCGTYSLRHEATERVGRQHQSRCLLRTLPRVLSSQEWAGYPGGKTTTFPQNGIYRVWGFCVAILVETIKGRTAGYRNR